MVSKRDLRMHGFTLTEMAVVLVIIALMTIGLITPLSTQRSLEARRDTGKSLDTIREALLGFAITHGRLPCPATSNIASDNLNAGVEAFTGNGCTCTGASSGIASAGGAECNQNSTVSGVVPWATLGLQETDAWGNRYTYLVTAAYARQPRATNTAYCDSGSGTPVMSAITAFALCTSGLASVRTSSPPSGVPLTTTNEVPAIVVSHGENGLGAWLSSGVQQAGAGDDELENANQDPVFVNNTAIDDLLVWISRPILMNRMISASKLP